MNKIIFSIFIIFIKYYFSLGCIEGENFCLKCDNQNNLCIQCKNEILIPDDQGGCIGIKKCNVGENYCNECNPINNLCQSCEIGYSPDNNGGCSYIVNCDISYKGLCLKCIENFILIGPDNGYKFCKSIYSSDLKNCKKINEENGICSECDEGYFLGQRDYKCSKTENCYESNFGTCNKCIDGYYLNRKNDACLLKEDQFQNCKETVNGENCEICDDNYFISEDNYCIKTNFCSETNDYDCIKCINNYFLAKNGNCTSTDNCLNAEGDMGLCINCLNEFYLDLKDEKCKSNELEDEYKYCSKSNEICFECISGYYLGEDNKCSTSKNCAESESGICIYCSDNYFLGKDNKCITTQNCAYTNDRYECIECNEGYLLVNKTCILNNNEKFINCKITDDAGKICQLCKNDFYLNLTDNICYSNQEYGQFYKCKKSSDTANICIECLSGYYLGYEDKKCTHTAACVSSDSYNQCHRCDEDYFCLNLNNFTCVMNEYITNEDNMMFYKCVLTNENGTKCDCCENSFEIGEKGYCYNIVDCDKKNNDKCVKCKEKNFYNFELCLNQYFGCVETSVKNCLKCDDPFDFETCTQCYEGYKLTENNYCELI